MGQGHSGQQGPQNVSTGTKPFPMTRWTLTKPLRRATEPRAGHPLCKEMLHTTRDNPLQRHLPLPRRRARWHTLLEGGDSLSISYHTRCPGTGTGDLPDGYISGRVSLSELGAQYLDDGSVVEGCGRHDGEIWEGAQER